MCKLPADSIGPPIGQCQLTMEPMAPLPAVGMKAMSATSALRTLQEGCQCSGWYEDMDRQILTPTSKRPLGDSMMKLQAGSSRKCDKAARGHDGESYLLEHEVELAELGLLC